MVDVRRGDRLGLSDRPGSVSKLLRLIPGKSIFIYRLRELRVVINRIIGTRNLSYEDIAKLERHGIPEHVQDDIERVCDIAERFDRKGWCNSESGNISCFLEEYDFGRLRQQSYTRFDEGYGRLEGLGRKLILITATKSRLEEDTRKDIEKNLGIIRINEEGEGYHVLFGFRGGKPTSDLGVHLALYSQREKEGQPIKAVLHPHAGSITDLASLNSVERCEDLTKILKELNIDPRVYLRRGIGLVRQEADGEPLMWGTPELIRETLKELKEHDIIVWEGHGPVAVGKTFEEALGRIETAEKYAECAFRRGYEKAGFRPLSEEYQRRLEEVLRSRDE